MPLRLLTAVLTVTAVGPCALASAQEAAPRIEVAGTPVLHVATPQPGGRNTPVAWVTFRTRQPVNVRLIVVRAGGQSGRSYGSGGADGCVRSTVVDDDGRGELRVGRRYAVEFFTRAGIGSTRPRTLATTRTLTARAFRVARGQRSSPTCAAAQPPASFTPTVAFHAGVRAFARIQGASVRSITVGCRPIPRVGDVGGCTGSFRVRRAGRTATYRLTSRASTFRNSPGSIEYRVHARTADRVAGLPRSVGGLLGFLQSRGTRP